MTSHYNIGEGYNLKDATKYGNKDAEQQAHSYSTMMLYEIADMIDDAPTAYDVDKVVEQIRDMQAEMEQFGLGDMPSDIIEIVRGGGVNEIN